MKNILKILLVVLPLCFFSFSFAQAYNLGDAFRVDDTHVCKGEYNDPLDCAANWANYKIKNETTPEIVVSNVITAVLSLLGVIFLIYVVYGGIIWMLASGSEERVSKAKTIIRQALIGLLITLSAYAISYFVLSALMAGNRLGPGEQINPYDQLEDSGPDYTPPPEDPNANPVG